MFGGWGVGFGVWGVRGLGGLGFGVRGLESGGFGVWGLGFEASSFGSWVRSLGFAVSGMVGSVWNC